MLYLSFDEISYRYGNLSEDKLTEEDYELTNAIYYNIVANLVEKSHTATGVLQFIGSEINEYNIFDFVPTEEISLSENWGDHLEDWELDLLMIDLPEGYKFDLMEGVWGNLAKILTRATRATTRTRKPSQFINPVKRMQAAQRSKRLGKPPTTKFDPKQTPSGTRSGSYGSSGSGGSKYSPRSSGDEPGVSIRNPDIAQPTSKTAAQRAYATAKKRDQRITAQNAVKSAEKQAAQAVKKSEATARKNAAAAVKQPRSIRQRVGDFTTGALTAGGAAYYLNQPKKDTAPSKETTVGDQVPGSSYRKGQDVGLDNGGSSGSNGSSSSRRNRGTSDSSGTSGSNGSSGSSGSRGYRGTSGDKLLQWVMNNPKRAREMRPGDRDYEEVRKILSKEEWITSYPELAKVITEQEQKEVTQMHNETIDAYDIILDYLIENGHAETVDEANYVMLEMSEDHLQAIVQLSVGQ